MIFDFSPKFNFGAEERTRTSTGLLLPAPKAGASTNSATSAMKQMINTLSTAGSFTRP